MTESSDRTQPEAAGKRLPAPPTAPLAFTLGLLACTMTGPFTGIPAILVGRAALRTIRESDQPMDGESVARAGVAMGWLGIILTFVLLGLIAIFLVIWFRQVQQVL